MRFYKKCVQPNMVNTKLAASTTARTKILTAGEIFTRQPGEQQPEK